jgi:hypothetical protein
VGFIGCVGLIGVIKRSICGFNRCDSYTDIEEVGLIDTYLRSQSQRDGHRHVV